MPEGADVEFEVLLAELRRLDEAKGVVLKSLDEASGAGTVGPLTPARELPEAAGVAVEELLAGDEEAVPVEELVAGDVDAVPFEEPLAEG